MPCIIPVFLNHWFFFFRLIAYVGTMSVVGGVALYSAPRAGRLGGLVHCAVGPVSSLIGSPNHSKKLPVPI